MKVQIQRPSTHHVTTVLLLVHERDQYRPDVPLQLQHPLGECGGCLHDPPLVARLDLEIVSERRVQTKYAPALIRRVQLVAEAVPEPYRLLLTEFGQVAAPLDDDLDL